MGQHMFALPDLVIPNGTALSNVLTATGAPTAPNMATDGAGFRDADSISIAAPATLPEATTVQVSMDESGAEGWHNLVRGGADVTIAAGKAVTVELISFKAIRLSAGGNVAAQRTFKVTKGVWV